MSVLIVDDSQDMCVSTQILLKATGYTDVQTALSARQAFSILGLGSPAASATTVDGILMDVSMPDINGIEACRQIKADVHLRDIPIIMVTGRNEEELLEEAFAAGAIDFVSKTAKPMEILVRLRSALALKRELDCRKMREQELSQLACRLEEANRVLEQISAVDAVTGLATRRRIRFGIG